MKKFVLLAVLVVIFISSLSVVSADEETILAEDGSVELKDTVSGGISLKAYSENNSLYFSLDDYGVELFVQALKMGGSVTSGRSTAEVTERPYSDVYEVLFYDNGPGMRAKTQFVLTFTLDQLESLIEALDPLA